MARILFLHTQFPGQFLWLAQALAEAGHDVKALAQSPSAADCRIAGDAVEVRIFGEGLKPDRPAQHLLTPVEMFVRRAASAAMEGDKLRDEGFTPDVIYSHTGWGAGAFLHNVFPRARIVKYCEWYYNQPDTGVRFLSKNQPAQRLVADDLLNLPITAELAHFNRLIAPTEWQRRQFPEVYRDRISVVPDGLDPELFIDRNDASFKLPNGRVLRRGDPIITYVARGADSFRGFGRFMKSLDALQASGRKFDCLIAGARVSYYGEEHGTEDQFRKALAGVSIDRERVHFLGTVSRPRFRQLLSVSAVHVYLTVPFVLSWSMIEAMAAGCCVVGSDTAPVREFIRDGENGLLADFFDYDQLAATVARALDDGELRQRLARKARSTAAERWSLGAAMRAHTSLLNQLLAAR